MGPGVFVGLGTRVSVGGGFVATDGGVFVGGATVAVSPLAGVPCGVTDGISPAPGVSVGARVGSGAWVGVATRVLWGSCNVEAGWGVAVGGWGVDVITTTVAAATGVVKR